MDSIDKKLNIGNNGAREKEVGSSDSRKGGKDIGAVFVVMSYKYAMESDFLRGNGNRLTELQELDIL